MSANKEAAGRGKKCAVCRKRSPAGQDLCEGCKASFDRMYPKQDQDTGDTTMSKNAAKNAASNAKLYPTALVTDEGGNARSEEALIDCLYEVCAGAEEPARFGLTDRATAGKALAGMGEAGKKALARANAAFTAAQGAKPEEEKAAKKTRAGRKAAPVVAAPPPVEEQDALDMPGGEDEEPEFTPGRALAADGGIAGEDLPLGGGEQPEADALSTELDAAEEVSEKKEPVSVKDAGNAPAWRASASKILKAALRPLEGDWYDWEAAGVKGVKAAVALLKNALEQQVRIENAAKGGGRAPAGKVDAGALVRVKAKHAKVYEGVLDAGDVLKVTSIQGTYVSCVTNRGAGERAMVPLAHLEVAPAETTAA